MVHRRSSEKLKQRKTLYEQQAASKKFMTDNAYNDRLIHETVNRATSEALTDHLSRLFDGVLVGAVPLIEPGIVLTNDYGHGILQNDQLFVEVNV